MSTFRSLRTLPAIMESSHETATDLTALQALLDRSYGNAGPYLKSIITPERRLSAAALCERLDGMCLLTLATVTADGRPIAAPVDGIFYRGAFYFGTSPDSVRWRHIQQRPQVSATHVPSEELSVTMHGSAAQIDIRAGNGIRGYLLDIYVPRYGPEWETFLDSGPRYARIDAEHMFTFYMPGVGT
ncbi:MAG: pyridoxamine 5'-phosphate oxidase family protein [Acidimicrobiaceae bacterium]|nr:pyridoxamine 5'-phosphate oxidase family protein [Acidimicrobiaceae bacterium]NNN16212.1 pyridoxamine 5'-phosphate oxidase family protein [Acidimicrobiaceae bacterium]